MARSPTHLKTLLGVDLPIIQAPMAGAQGSAMAVAVSEAGGLGSLPCAMLDVDGMKQELATIRERTGRPLNVNFFCHPVPEFDAVREEAWRAKLAPYFREFGITMDLPQSAAGRSPVDAGMIEILAQFRPAVVSFHFGLPAASLVERVKELGAKVLSSATTVEEALWLESNGADIIVAQGIEAGGHRGMFLSRDLTTQVGTFALLPQVVQAVSVPVVAAGGIASANGVAAAFTLGAAGVQIGTAYLLCPEATIRPAHRATLKSSASRHTALTNLFTGRPARGIVNRLMRELEPMDVDVPEFPLASAAISPLRAKGDSLEIGDFSPLWSGQNASGCKEIPAGQLTRELASGL